jgi:hypothetical protein
MGDIQLALFLARLLHGAGSAAERSLVEHHLLAPLRRMRGGGGGGGGGAADAAWAEAACAWMLGDAGGCLEALLPALRPTGQPEIDPGTALQLLPALALLAPAAAAAPRRAPPAGEELQCRLLRACLAGSDTLQGAGIPALALQLELVAQRCRAELAAAAAAASDGGGSGRSGSLARRAAWACASALLYEGAGASLEVQLAALQAAGLSVDAAAAASRLAALQRCLPPAAGAGCAWPGGGGLRGRQASVDTQRSGLSRSGSARMSFEARRGGGGRGGGGAAGGAVLGDP